METTAVKTKQPKVANRFSPIRVDSPGDRIIEQHEAAAQDIADMFNQAWKARPVEMEPMTVDQLFTMIAGGDSALSIALRVLGKANPPPAGIRPDKWQEMQLIPDSVEDFLNRCNVEWSIRYRGARGKRSSANTSENFPYSHPSQFLAFRDGAFVVTEEAQDAIVQRNGLFITDAEQNNMVELCKGIAANLKELEQLAGQRSFEVVQRFIAVDGNRDYSANVRAIIGFLKERRR